MSELPFGGEPVTGWRAAPDCGRCNDTGRYQETRCIVRDGQHQPGVIDAHCTCKRGRRMSELWIADKLDVPHPNQYEPSEPTDINEEDTRS